MQKIKKKWSQSKNIHTIDFGGPNLPNSLEKSNFLFFGQNSKSYKGKKQNVFLNKMANKKNQFFNMC